MRRGMSDDGDDGERIAERYARIAELLRADNLEKCNGSSTRAARHLTKRMRAEMASNHWHENAAA